jgi:hypothetical protein
LSWWTVSAKHCEPLLASRRIPWKPARGLSKATRASKRRAQLLVGEALATEPALVEESEAGKADAGEVDSVAEEADLPARAVERVEKADDAE